MTLFIFFLFWGFTTQAQAKYEREFRIKKSEFPQKALELVNQRIKDARKIRYYKEIDSVTITFESKFKKDKLHYSVNFNSKGELEDIEIQISKVDIPSDVWSSIAEHLNGDCKKFKIRRLQQQYPLKNGLSAEKIINDAFQNLILPYINYELIVVCKRDSGREEFEYLFNAQGDFVSKRKSLPANYDHILY
ncbi:hypothetical protein EQY75_11675 [Muriicola soli]|uniref:Uncharacterized protein n=1 Tax=Muriicola soli TaxID=2507538 RepID=A0A411EBW5_9FLAO|nr:hypothetical protein EQY75_11675 [Muriicola soli]